MLEKPPAAQGAFGSSQPGHRALRETQATVRGGYSIPPGRTLRGSISWSSHLLGVQSRVGTLRPPWPTRLLRSTWESSLKKHGQRLKVTALG